VISGPGAAGSWLTVRSWNRGSPDGPTRRSDWSSTDPTALLAGLVRALLDLGGSIAEGARVRALEPGPPPTLALEDGRVVAEHVVLGMNGFTRELVPELQEIRAALTLALCTEPLAPSALDAIGMGEGRPFYTVDLPYLWGRVLPDGRVIFGGGLAFDPQDDLTRIDLQGSDAGESLSRLEARVRGLHPGLADVHIATRWGGPIAFRPNRRPLLARVPRDSPVIVTGAYAGHGVALALRIGEIVAESIAGRRELPAWGGR
jgi:glycine/D-amino acid oxidase-like deaminating enzyme